ncbi:protein kinase [Sorangium cellulosum]|uniref:Protein kinase n=1 Tax=Sorangium cellulosum TaxID=56 RepID=A0A4P2QTL4_SORCE|nr:serine/threonine-protein kinase [Sorangium cellulosum]AUX33468.1 protein kinase [Sorangium cellulosum]
MTPDRTAQLLAPVAQPGELIAAKYRVERVVAIGGMGVVLAARNEDLDQQVAIKILRQDALTNQEAVARFLREARTAARLQGEHVARVFDVGTTESGVPFMVMEFLSGLDLQQVIETHGPLSIQDAVDYVLQALEAVAEAHAAGVVHRDIKPSNLFLAEHPDGTRHIKVLDFGISKGQGLDSPAEPGLTSTKQVMGSPGYMSPEQMMAPRTVDGRADVWSFGVLLYTLVTGEPPFQGETVAAVMANILHQPVPRLRDKRSDAPATLERIVARCLERDVSARYANVGKLAQALEPLGSSFAKLSTSRIQSAIGAASPAGQTLLNSRAAEDSDRLSGASWTHTGFRRRSRRRLLMAAGVAALLAGVAGAGVWLVGSVRVTAEAPSSAAASEPDRPGGAERVPGTAAAASAAPPSAPAAASAAPSSAPAAASAAPSSAPAAASAAPSSAPAAASAAPRALRRARPPRAALRPARDRRRPRRERRSGRAPCPGRRCRPARTKC